MRPPSRPHNRALSRRVLPLAAAAAACALSACAGPVAQRPHRTMPVAVNSAAVLAPATPWGDTLDQYADAADQQRRDGDLAVRGSGPILASGEWPEPAVPSLADWQYLTLPQDARTILYFDPYYGSRWDGGWRPWPGRRAYRP